MYSIALVVLNLVKLTLHLNLSKIKNVYVCQQSVETFDDDCERLYSMMVKTNKRSGIKLIRVGSYSNALGHYKMVKEMRSRVIWVHSRS